MPENGAASTSPALSGNASRARESAPMLQALLVTFLWSTSWMLIKIGLADISALTFAGLRYLLAFVILLPLALRERTRAEIAALTSAQWRRLAVLGLVMYSLNQGTQFLASAQLPAQTASLVLSFPPVAVALAGSFFLGERLAYSWHTVTPEFTTAAGIDEGDKGGAGSRVSVDGEL